MFFIVILSIWILMNVYAGWRICSLPLIGKRMRRYEAIGFIFFLASSYLLSRFLNSQSWLARALEFIGSTWIGILFLVCVCFLVVDIVTVFGLVFKGVVSRLRMLALCSAALLSIIAVVQGHRSPEVRSYEVRVNRLPAALDKTVIVAASDLHLGNRLDHSWAQARVQQISALRPDVIILCGDVIEGDDPSERELLLQLARLRAPFGVWAVNGNHESHGSSSNSANALEFAGIRVLRNEWAEVRPGFVLAGVDDLTHVRRQGRDPHFVVAHVLSGIRPRAATVFVSHSPLQADTAASAGISLMLSGHTHNGQIWPFNYLVRELYPYMSGQYTIGRMSLIVSRGAGTWGPRMRLWQRGEIIKIVLRAAV